VDSDYDYMTTEVKLSAQLRSEKNGNIKKVRESGYVPANVYGPGTENKNIKVKEVDFQRVFNAAGESHLIDLTIGGGAPVKVIVKDVQRHPIKGSIIHVDFYQVDMSKKIITEIPLRFVGESRAVKELGGILIKNMDSLEVKCLPGDLVDSIDVDLSGLNNFHDVIRAGDLILPPGIELTEDENETIASVVEPSKEEEREGQEEEQTDDKKDGEEKGKEEKEGEKSGEEKGEGGK
jgi:large subunit ribosomal protein L25